MGRGGASERQAAPSRLSGAAHSPVVPPARGRELLIAEELQKHSSVRAQVTRARIGPPPAHRRVQASGHAPCTGWQEGSVPAPYSRGGPAWARVAQLGCSRVMFDWNLALKRDRHVSAGGSPLLHILPIINTSLTHARMRLSPQQSAAPALPERQGRALLQCPGQFSTSQGEPDCNILAE